MSQLIDIGKRAKKASMDIAALDIGLRNKALEQIAAAITENSAYILEQNEKDLVNAKENGMSTSMQDRLRLTRERILGIAEGVRKVIQLDDPLGEITSMKTRPNGLRIGAKRVPLGVIGIIYEARPNVTPDAAVLCLKAGNAVILRGGKEAIHSNIALANTMRNALKSLSLNPDMIQLIEDVSRETAHEMMRLNQYIDVLIPRGGAGLIRTVVETASIPVIQTGIGNCHIYVDKSADLKMAVNILYNAKCSRPSVCNAAESLLVHKDIAKEFLPLAKARLDEKKVELRGCERTAQLLPGIIPATEDDYYAEYNDYIMSVKVVDTIDQAIEHINQYNTKHSDAIVTSDYFAAQKFLDLVDSAAVYVNASTRFTDGYEFGFGAEIGISTQKLHARGPMGLKELTTIKYVIYGNGQIRE
ncbi:MAG: glutamate-5-semialdehyde dehydrogenase [Clostridiales bacterium]|nr:glutamate-5-semialdehyde dehydrogenase [Clostridiales bacterium]